MGIGPPSAKWRAHKDMDRDKTRAAQRQSTEAMLQSVNERLTAHNPALLCTPVYVMFPTCNSLRHSQDAQARSCATWRANGVERDDLSRSINATLVSEGVILPHHHRAQQQYRRQTTVSICNAPRLSLHNSLRTRRTCGIKSCFAGTSFQDLQTMLQSGTSGGPRRDDSLA